MKTPFVTSAIIITNPRWFGAEEQLGACLKTLIWCDEIILIVSEITPSFRCISKSFSARLVIQQGTTFSQWRNFAADQARGDWLFYVDTDERVTPQLQQEIQKLLLSSPSCAAYAVPRSNIILGKEMRHGGWWPDYVLRLIKKSQFLCYEGDLHEQPKINGQVGYLKSPLLHYKHQHLEDMLEKTLHWSHTEAKLMYDAHHPPMNPRRFLRPYVTEIFTRLILKLGILDGTEGLIDGIYQGFSRFISYAQLWQMQLANQKLKTKN